MNDLALLLQICSFIAALIGAFVALNTRATIAELRREISEGRNEDREALRAWINGSFMRASVVEAKMAAFERRLSLIEDKD